jgi:hypothetical protein
MMRIVTMMMRIVTGVPAGRLRSQRTQLGFIRFNEHPQKCGYDQKRAGNDSFLQ